MLILVLLLGSCKSLFLDKQQLVAFKVLDKLNYPYQEITNNNVSKSFSDLLEEKDIVLLENWIKSTSILANLLQAECAGCSNKTANLKPVYKKAKGKFIHFGLKDDMGIENLVFKKNGRFLTRFYMFQGESNEKINEELKDTQDIDYVVEGVYPTAIEPQSIYLEHIEFQNSVIEDNSWYPAMFPTKIRYRIDLAEKNPVLRFKIYNGLYSYQKPDKNGQNQIVNFVEPLVYANAVAINEPMSYSSFTDAFYANATFFLLDLDEDAEVSIRMKSKMKEMDFRFSVLENNDFFTMEEYLQKGSPTFDRYLHSLDKGSYLIRVLHKNADYMESPLYSIEMNITNVH
nr:hypothetical protein [uncultured Allomuricauda sp.]